jgi:hypothetical protein
MTEQKRNPNLAAPMVMRGFNSYHSPVSGELIQSRKEREQDLVRHDCMPAQDVKPKKPRGQLDA